MYKCVYLIYEAFCLDVAQGYMEGAPNETRNVQMSLCLSRLSFTLVGMSQIELFDI